MIISAEVTDAGIEDTGVCIQVDENTRIYELDSLNYAIQLRKVVKSGDNVGNDYWVTLSYHSTIDSLAKKLVHNSIRGKTLTSLQQVIKCIDDNVVKMTNNLKELMSVTTN